MKLPIALQFYTVREESSRDFVGTLEKVAEMGYKGIEFAGYGGLSAKELKGHLERLGLEAVGSHNSVDQLTNSLEEVIEYNLEIGSKYVACAYSKFETREKCLEMARFFNKVGEKCREEGLNFAYHNHAHELIEFDGKHGLDLLYESTDPDNVKAEIDTHWIQRGGLDPAEYVLKYTGRCPLVHIKDMNETKDGFAEVGTGIMDIGSIVSAAEKAGSEWLIVEQDRCSIPCLESAETSFKNLKKIVEEA